MLSKKASRDCHGQDSPYFFGWQEYEKNPYHSVQNPTGIIQMGLAENDLSFDLLEEWLERNPHSVEITKRLNGSSSESLFRQLALFQDYHGLPALKQELVSLMAEIRGNHVEFDPNKLVLTAGSTSANEILIFCLADPGEAFLLPTPYYPGFDRDLKWRTGVEIVPIRCSSSNDFRITVSALEEAHQQAQKLGLKVKGVLITNPSNPLGTTMSQQELNHLLDFAIQKQIHIISDEIYSGTVFCSPAGFIGITKALAEKNVQPDHAAIWTRVHIVSSLSKDLGLPGFRVGMIYSDNEFVVSTARKMSSFGLVSSQTQNLVLNILSDKKFMSEYMKENKKRIRKRKEMLVSELRLRGIRCLKSNAGLFCWVDMRHLLSSNTFEAEKELWVRILTQVRVNISPGSSFHCSEPGWFRMCFANISEETLRVAMKRLKEFINLSNNSTTTGAAVKYCLNHRQGHRRAAACNSRKRSLATGI